VEEEYTKQKQNIKCFEYNLLYITLYTHVDDLIYSKEVNKTITTWLRQFVLHPLHIKMLFNLYISIHSITQTINMFYLY